MRQEHVATFRLYPAARLLRPHQWLKNGFVVLGLIFSHRWHDTALLASVGLSFASFCCMASAVYIFNDIADVESDRRHVKKHLRPIASGQVAVTAAWFMCGALVSASLILGSLVSQTALALVGCYAAMNIAYSYRLKHVVIIDVFVISAGFMLRILMGTLGVGIPPSSWLMLCGMMLTLLLGFGKRRAELKMAASSDTPARKVLEQYDVPLVDQFLSMTAACAILSYSIYTVSADTVQLHGTDKLVYTVPFFVYGVFRYFFLIHRLGMGHDTARDLLTDHHMIATVIGWIVVTGIVLA